MVRFSTKLMFVVLCLGCARDTVVVGPGDRPPPADKLFVHLGDQSWEFVYPLNFDVWFWNDGPGIVAISVGVPEVFSLHLQGPSSMLPAFSVPVVGRALGPLQEGAAEANLLWIKDGYTLAPSGQVEISIEPDRIVGRVAEHNLSFSSARTLGCMVRCETIPNCAQETLSGEGFAFPNCSLEPPVFEDGRRGLCGDNHFASPQCAALKASLP